MKFDELRFFINLSDSPSFSNCTNLESVILPDNIIRITNFYHCYKIKISSTSGQQFPSHLRYINYDAFNTCNSIPVYNFPPSLYSMDASVSGNNGWIKNVILIFRGTTPPVRANSSHPLFSDSFFIKYIYVPDEVIEDYKAMTNDFGSTINLPKLKPLSEWGG